MANQPIVPKFSGREFYGAKPPGQPVADYDRLQNAPELPGVPPPSGSSAFAAQQATMPPGSGFDPDAPDILKLIQGGRFRVPFTVTLMRRAGVQVFKSDAGQKTEAKYELAKETIAEPADLLRLLAGIKSEIYKPVNDLTLEFQLMLYIALNTGAMTVPGAPVPPSDKGKVTAGETVES